ncbi:MAG: hypothetical protein ABH856_04095, partial [Patescibacteria group bacterium]
NIPLYGLSEDGGPVPLKLDDFILRVRTPCVAECDFESGSCKKPPEFCDERYELDSVFTGSSSFALWPKELLEDTVISWSIENGLCGSVYCYLDNMLILNPKVTPTEAIEQDSSLITAHRITDKLDEFDGKFEVLVQDSVDDVYGLVNSDEKKKSPASEFLGMGKFEGVSKLTSDSYLKLSFIKGVTDDNYEKTPLPYLEYQFLYNSDTSGGVASLMPEDLIVVSEGSSGGFKKILKARYSPKTGIINYVIQQ